MIDFNQVFSTDNMQSRTVQDKVLSVLRCLTTELAGGVYRKLIKGCLVCLQRVSACQ